MRKKASLIPLIIGILLVFLIVANQGKYLEDQENNDETEEVVSYPEDHSIEEDSNDLPTVSFVDPTRSLHHETNTPSHGAMLPGVPINVVIDFNFDLSDISAIEIFHEDGIDYGVGITSVDDSKLTLRRSMNPNSPEGLYTVKYSACWPDNSCHSGQFQFYVLKSLASEFIDLRNQTEVVIDMKDEKFSQENIIVSPNTKVIWTNSEVSTHYINTDSHPAHTYFLPQNSRAIEVGESFEVTFTEKGIYPYHCSAHPTTMRGNILVE